MNTDSFARSLPVGPMFLRTMTSTFTAKPHRIMRLAVIVLVIGLWGITGQTAHAAQRCVSPREPRCFTSIQAAVDAARSGDTITIKGGTYTQQVSIDGKNLTLIGERDTVIRAPTRIRPTRIVDVDFSAVIAVQNATVALRSLTVDGRNVGNNNPELTGILYSNAGGEIRESTVTNTGFQGGLRDTFEGNGILVFNVESGFRTITIVDNRVTRYNNNGITVIGDAIDGRPSLTANLIGNTVIGAGPTDVLPQYAIQYGTFDPAFPITGVVRGNYVSNSFFTGEGFPAEGIATVFAIDTTVADNTVINSQRGIDLYFATRSTARENTVRGPQPNAPGYLGIGVSGEDNRVIENTLINLEVGIRLYNNPDDGTAVNTTVANNRFQGVAIKVDEEAGASAVERFGTTASAATPFKRTLRR